MNRIQNGFGTKDMQVSNTSSQKGMYSCGGEQSRGDMIFAGDHTEPAKAFILFVMGASKRFSNSAEPLRRASKACTLLVSGEQLRGDMLDPCRSSCTVDLQGHLFFL